MNSFWNDHGTKILGWFTTTLGTIGTLLLTGAFNGLLADTSIRWLTIIVAVLTGGTGVATVQRGNVNTAQIKVADAIATALNTAPPKQGGFARVGLLLAVAMAAMTLLAGCQTNPETGERELTETGKASIALLAGELTDRYIAESPDRARSIANIRSIAVRLQSVTDVVTVSDLRQKLDAEVALLDLSDIDRRSVNRFLPLLEALARDYIGSDRIESDELVRVNEFLSLVLLALPPS